MTPATSASRASALVADPDVAGLLVALARLADALDRGDAQEYARQLDVAGPRLVAAALGRRAT